MLIKKSEYKISFNQGILYEAPLQDSGNYFIFSDQNILLKTSETVPEIPNGSDLNAIGIEDCNAIYFGEMNEVPCFIIRLNEKINFPSEYSLINLRSIYGLIDDDLFWIAGKAFHLGSWNSTSKFCGSCGSKTAFKSDEISRVCPNCGLTSFPRISPAVIMAVIKDGKILLANNNRWKNSMYSVLAGFVDVGESLEECVRREVKEEAGIEIKNIKYFGSQPWHFSGSLMIAFTAEYAEGELKLDNLELTDGGWFSPDDMPEISRKPSISRQLIDWFVETYK